MRGFRITIERERDVATLSLVGELDLASAPTLSAKLASLPDVLRVVIDLRRLAFIDAAGMRALVRADAAARRTGLELAVVPGPRQVRQALKLTGLDARLPLVEDPDDLTAPSAALHLYCRHCGRAWRRRAGAGAGQRCPECGGVLTRERRNGADRRRGSFRRWDPESRTGRDRRRAGRGA